MKMIDQDAPRPIALADRPPESRTQPRGRGLSLRVVTCRVEWLQIVAYATTLEACLEAAALSAY